MKIFRKFSFICISIFCLSTVEIQSSSYLSTICFYATPCYALSVSFDLMHENQDETSRFVGWINAFSSKIPQTLRCKMFRKALQTPSGIYENEFFPYRFADFFNNYLGAVGNDLYYLSCTNDKAAELEKEFKAVKQFYTYLIDSLNPRLVGSLHDTDKIYQLRITNSLLEAQQHMQRRMKNETLDQFKRVNLSNLKLFIGDLYKYAVESFAA